MPLVFELAPSLRREARRVTGTEPEVAVCLMTETFHPVTGGGETQARALAEGLQARGTTVQILTRRSDTALAKQELVGNVPVRRLGPAGPGHMKKWGLLFTAFFELLTLRKRYNVILVCGFRVLGIPALVVHSLLARPCILKADSQGEVSGKFFDAGLRRFGLSHDRFPASVFIRARNALLRRATRFVAISSVIEREYIGAGIPPGRIVRIPNSVDVSRFQPVSAREKSALRSRLGIADKRPVAVYTGRLETTKGLPSLLRAWQSVLVHHPGALLVLVGSGGLGMQNCEELLRRQVTRNRIGSSIFFAGSVDNVHEFLQAGDIFVFPSTREAFGISVIEAMACRLPVVTTGVDGIADIVRSNDTALVVKPDDDPALAAAIVRALNGGDAIDAMAEAARESALQCYSSDRIIAAYRKLLGEVLCER